MAFSFLPCNHPDGVLFTFQGDDSITSVAVAGTFNCWVGDTCPLTRVSATRWQTILPIAPGRHLYKYVVNGTDWILDPANPWISEDAQNNSCFTLTDTGAVFIRHAGITAQSPSEIYQRHAALDSPDWVRDGVIYELSVRAFAGDFAGLEGRLDYLSDLGVTIIWLMPIHPIGVRGRLGKHGDPYATYDFGAIDPALGTPDAFRRLVNAIHLCGLRVLMDIPLNRSSCDSVLVQHHPDWFTHNAQGEIYYAVPNRDYFAGFDFKSRGLRDYLLDMMTAWVRDFDVDGFRFDDSDLTPLDFMNEIRERLALVKPDIGLLSQSYDELHHLAACDLTYDGGVREMMYKVARGQATNDDFYAAWMAATYSFPRHALRMRWLEEKEQGRAFRYYGVALHHAAATILFTLDGVPFVLMGQEFNEPRWQTWASLFDDFSLDWDAVDADTFRHYQALLRLRQRYPALRRGTVTFLPAAPGLIRYTRTTETQKLLITVNLTDQPQVIPPTDGKYRTIYAGWTDHEANGRELAPCAYRIQVRIESSTHPDDKTAL